ncbi:MAG: UPF0182 family protein [Proteobacteria bacterium]|nr:UPF0182 family protein [Pseudomonadota bacterium]
MVARAVVTTSYPRPSSRTIAWQGGILLLVLLMFSLPALAHFYIDYQWFRSVGHEDVFVTLLSTKAWLGAGVGLVTLALLLANLQFALRASAGLTSAKLTDPDGIPRVDLGQAAKRLVLPMSIAIGLVSMLSNLAKWDLWLKFSHAMEFGTADPIFDRDVGFYLFRLPLLETLTGLFLWTVGFIALTSGAVYLMRGAIASSVGQISVHPRARHHLAVLAGLFFLGLACDTYLDAYGLLYSELGPMTGASYADVNARLPALRVKAAVALLAGGVLVYAILQTRPAYFAAAFAGYIATHVLGVGLYPYLVHRFNVVPNEFEKESPYLQHNITATRAAYGLENVLERELSGEIALTRQDIERNEPTVANIRLWDHQPLLDTFAQIQEIRTYYEFASVDNDRYEIEGRLRQTMLSPRELSTQSLPNRTWINERFTFTHGYGLTLGPVNEATNEGLPVLMIKDIPPGATQASVTVTRPSIYYGELSNDHVFVGTRTREFNYPSGEGNVYSEYDGKGGITIGSWLMRAAVASRIGSVKLLLSQDVDGDSRMLLYRNINERVRKIAPFLDYDSDPYMVVRHDGTLVWILDAYTTSDRYPYAKSAAKRVNYIRNSVKVVVEAYDGSVTFYAVDDKDPVLRMWRSVFPETFRGLSEMPADVRSHLRYPERIFELQTQMFTVYHMGEPALLYNREDQWEVPLISRGESREQMHPYYTIMKLPGEESEEFILMLPFTPKSKDNLAAWMVARSDGDKLGHLVVYRFPKDRLVFGPQQIINRINQDADISRQISLWDQRGSEALFGTLLVIPIEESLIYVRPLYLRSAGGRIPELKRVIVVYENKIAMEPSLSAAMDAIFPPDGRSPAPQAASAREAVATAQRANTSKAILKSEPLAVQALQHFERAIRSQREGNWAEYGQALARVEALLRELQPDTQTP